MLQADDLLGAVDQKARLELEGIGMVCVLSPSNDKKEDNDAEEDKKDNKKVLVRDNEEEGTACDCNS